jgi:4-hydroxy-3-methylbut-2-enyl diphosphate reductase
MEVICPRLSGFCPGVKNAEKRLFQMKKKYPGQHLYVVGNMINNLNYIHFLERNGIETVDNTDGLKKGSIVAIRTHGMDRHLEKKLHDSFEVIDLTCSNVKKAQIKIKDYSERGYHVVITGKKHHPEIIGLTSYADENSVIETEKDLETLLTSDISFHRLTQMGNLDIFIVSQTTGSRTLFEKTIRELSKPLKGVRNREWYDSICPVTVRKEEEACELQKNADISIVIGDRLSSNAHNLFQALSRHKENVYLIEDVKALDAAAIPPGKYKKALVVSAASTPSFIEREVCDYVKEL